jgi:hypothetical protein
MPIIGITRSPLKSHRFFDPRNSVSMKTLFMLFINHGNHDDSFVEVIIHNLYGFWLWFIRNVELNKYQGCCCNSQKPSRSNSANKYERGLMAEKFRAFDLRTESYNRFESWWILFSFYFFPFIFNFYVIFFSTYFSMLSPFFSSIDFFKFQNRLVQCLARVM